MKYIDLMSSTDNLSKAIVTQTSNSFGDQILEFKFLQSWVDENGQLHLQYKLLDTIRNQEGDWMTLKDMKMHFKKINKKV